MGRNSPRNILGQTSIGIDSLKGELLKLVNQQISSNQAQFVSIYFIDLTSEIQFGLNETKLYDQASLLKMIKMMALFKIAESAPQVLKQMILYREGKIRPLKQNILPPEKLKDGQNYSIEELIERMIISSDNVASNLISENFGTSIVENTYTDLGINYTNSMIDNTKVKDYATVFKHLFGISYLNQQMSEKALQLLAKTSYQQGLVAGVPKNIRVAHKFGERSWTESSIKQLHDCGIIYYPDHPYILCVMTKGNNFVLLSQVIKEISSLTYQQLNKQLNKRYGQ